jgi:hypothetical protein
MPLMLVRATRGPVLLIIAGTLFAVDHFGPYPFERTWPVLIIVVGLWKLAEHLLARGSAPQYTAPPWPPQPPVPPAAPPPPTAPGGPHNA